MSVATETPIAHSAPSGVHVFRAITRRALRDRRRSVLAWSLSLGALSAFEAAIWPSIEGAIGKAVKSYPKGLKEAFGIGQLDSVRAYLEAEMFSLILPLAIAFLAVRVVAAMLSAAEEQHHLDTLLSAPVPRRALGGAAYGVAGMTVAAVLLLSGALTWVAAGLAGSGLSAGPLAGALVAVWSLAMLFAGFATLAAGLLHRASIVTAAVMGTVVTMYVVDLVGKLATSVDSLRWASAFKYYDSPLRDGADPLACAGLLAVGICCALIGAERLERRDVL